MNEKDFELITVLAKTQNITKAAELLYISQPTLSKRIITIERELGVPIIVRSKQGVRFTAEGEEVCRRTTEAATQLQYMRRALEAQKGYVNGTLNAGVSVNFSLYRLPRILAIYRKEFPYVNTKIISDYSRKVFVKLSEGSIDVAVIRGEFSWKGNKILVDRERICAIISEQDVGKSLSEIPFIGRRTDSVYEKEVDQWLEENNIVLDQYGMQLDNIITCVEMVKQGIGWAIVPEICLGDFKGHIQPLFFANGEPLIRSTYLMYTDAAYSLPQVRSFIDLMRHNTMDSTTYTAP